LVVEFEASGLRQNECCRNHGLALSTLQRQLKKRRLGNGPAKEGSRLVAVELARKNWDENSRPGGAVVFDFRLGREREGPKRFLGNFEGILQTDGYAAYDHVGGPKMVHAACWAHARREFFQTVELNPGDQRAVGIVAQMDRLFEVEAQALQEALSPEDRHSLRLEKSRPLLDTIKSQIEAARSGATAEEHAGKSLQLHLDALEAADPLSGISSAGVE
jgi:hypothetical protein